MNSLPPLDLIPTVQQLQQHQGLFRLRAGSTLRVAIEGVSPGLMLSLLDRHLGIVTAPAGLSDADLCLRVAPTLDFGDKLRPEQRVEAYRLHVTPQRIEIAALHSEGLLRAIATLAQMAQHSDDGVAFACMLIRDWPMFRFRCASDWLVNVECNRWACDHGDGHDAFLARVRRKLDLCFRHKINMVWFDGFGWDTRRFPGYAELMRQCNDDARRLGIKLAFGGYGGGYGTAYQRGEIYRSGYFGQVFRNRRSDSSGEEYPCRGNPNPESRYYGTCLSNEPLRREKLDELMRFVREVRPGCLYVHDIDVGTWLETEASWLLRCDTCRKQWPSDALENVEGQAAACASWFRDIRFALNALPPVDDYVPSRDLQLILASPLYTHYRERSEKIWQREMRYFETLSRLIGPMPGISFTLREQFDNSAGRPRFAELRERMDRHGFGHGLHVAVFGGGDTFCSDDLTSTIGATAHYYEGAESVYLSNAGIHSDPVQMLNAECLWHGSAKGFKDAPGNKADTEAWFDQLSIAARKPPQIFSPGGLFDQLCVQRWGAEAGPLMSRALQSRCEGRLPVGYIWWSITKPVYAMADDVKSAYAMSAKGPSALFYFHEKDWRCRIDATFAARTLAEQAAAFSDDEDVHWLASCLDVGGRFAGVVRQLVRVASGRASVADDTLQQLIDDLDRIIRTQFPSNWTDPLGGETGCWLPTLDTLRSLHNHVQERRHAAQDVAGDFLDRWLVNDVKHRTWPGAYCSLRNEFANREHVTLTCQVVCDESMPVALHLGYTAPVQVLIDGRQVWCDPDVSKRQQHRYPSPHQAASIPWNANAGCHELTIVCRANDKGSAGVFAYFERHDGASDQLPKAIDHDA